MFLSSLRKVISAWQLTPCLFWLHTDDPYMVFSLQNWTTLLVPIAPSEECIESIPEIMLPGFGAPKPKETSISALSAGVVECVLNCTKEKALLQLALTPAWVKSLSGIITSGILLDYWNDYYLSTTINKNILLLHIA